MSKAVFIVDASEVEKMLEDFTGKEMRKAGKTALRKSANKLKRAAKKQLKQTIHLTGKHNYRYVNGQKINFSDNITDAIRAKVYEDKNGDMFFKVHTLGTQATTSGTYRARFFEKQENTRKTKKGWNRGRIGSKHFFTTATTSAEADVFNDMQNEIAAAVIKINQKKYG